MQRITIPEIQKHPWFLKNLPIEFMEDGDGNNMQSHTEDDNGQSIEEILSIIQEARKPGEGPRLGEQFIGGSMNLDEISDTDIDDIETSGDFVCAL